MMPSRSNPKNVFWPNLGVGPSFQFLDIPAYACGLKLGAALTLSQNPNFMIASKFNEQMALLRDFGVGRHDLINKKANSSKFYRINYIY